MHRNRTERLQAIETRRPGDGTKSNQHPLGVDLNPGVDLDHIIHR